MSDMAISYPLTATTRDLLELRGGQTTSEYTVGVQVIGDEAGGYAPDAESLGDLNNTTANTIRPKWHSMLPNAVASVTLLCRSGGESSSIIKT